RRADSPLVDFAVLRDRVFATGIVAGLLSYAVLFGSLFLFPFYLERILGRTPGETGLLLSPVPIAIGVLAPISGIVADKVGSRLPTVLGMLVSTAALLVLAFLPAAGPAFLAIVLLAVGAGLGFFTPANNSAIMGSAPRNRLGVAGGILNMTRSLGTSLGGAVTGALLSALLSARMGEQIESTLSGSPSILAAAAHESILFLAALALVAGVLSAIRGAAVEETVQAQ